MTDEEIVSMLDALSNVALAAAGLGAIAFIALYFIRSNWRATPLGRSIMGFFTILAIIIVLVEVFDFWDANETFVDWLALIFFSALAVAMWRLVYVLIRTQRRERRERRDEDERNH